jgi:hypothetical protein
MLIYPPRLARTSFNINPSDVLRVAKRKEEEKKEEEIETPVNE